MRLSKNNIKAINPKGVIVPDEKIFGLPEKVLQFGTGVLLRGLPDFFIDKANQQGIFNGRIVLVKSTPYGDTKAFDEQDGLFTQVIRGFEEGKKVEATRINASISRVLSAKDQWEEILACANNPDMQVIISNTTEVGIVLDVHDSIYAHPPLTFACKLLAFLYKRYWHFKGDTTKGMVIIPTELIHENGAKLEAIVLELAHLNNVDPGFMDWLESSNHFCNSLVDRIIPVKLTAAQKFSVENEVGFTDDLMIMSECYSCWAIETSDEKVAAILSFSKADKGVIIEPDIDLYRELKVRLLNGTHTYACGLAILAGFETVKQAMDNKTMADYIERLMKEEIAAAIPYEVGKEEAERFCMQTLDRFRNPFIDHLWLSITLQYSAKMKMRNLPVLLEHYQQSTSVPEYMALGFAAHILFMKCTEENGEFYGIAKGNKYVIQDDNAAIYEALWRNFDTASVVHEILSEDKLWEDDLSVLPGFEQAVINWLDVLQHEDALHVINQFESENQVA